MKENSIKKEEMMNIMELSADRLDGVTGGGMYIGVDYPKPGSAAARRFDGPGALGPGMGPGMGTVPVQEPPLKNPMLDPKMNPMLDPSAVWDPVFRRWHKVYSDSPADGTAE